MKDLHVDPERATIFEESTYIPVRAIGPDGTWDSWDLGTLTKESFTEFVRSRGIVSAWAMSIFWALLGYDRNLESDTADCPQCGWKSNGANSDLAGYEHYEETGHVWELHSSDSHAQLEQPL